MEQQYSNEEAFPLIAAGTAFLLGTFGIGLWHANQRYQQYKIRQERDLAQKREMEQTLHRQIQEFEQLESQIQTRALEALQLINLISQTLPHMSPHLQLGLHTQIQTMQSHLLQYASSASEIPQHLKTLQQSRHNLQREPLTEEKIKSYQEQQQRLQTIIQNISPLATASCQQTIQLAQNRLQQLTRMHAPRH